MHRARAAILQNATMGPGACAIFQWWRRAFVACLLLCCAVPALALSGSVLVAARGELTPDQALGRLTAGQGAPFGPSTFYAAGPGRELWFLLDTGPAVAQARHLVLPYPGLDLARLFLAPGQTAPSAVAGDSVPVGRWTVPYTHPVLPLLQRGGPVLVQVHASHRISFPWSVRTAEDFEEERKWFVLLLGAYLGLVTLVLVLSTINAVSWRDPAHGAYAAYVFVLALTQASLSGVAGYYFWPDDPAWSDLASVVFPMVSLSLLALFVWTFVRPLPWRWAEVLLGLYGLAGLLLAVMFALLGREITFALANYVFMFGVLLFLVLVGWYGWRRSPAGWWVLAGLIALLGGAGFQVLRNLGLMPMNLATQYGAQIGAAIEIPLLLVALYRRGRDRRDMMIRQAALQDRDPLTGLVNDFFTRRQLAQVILRARASPGQAGILQLRVANLPQIADESGQQMAGAAMLHAASCVSRIARPGDTVGRLANGDFLVVLEHAGGEERLRSDAARVVARGLLPDARLRGQTLKFHVAFSVAPEDWETAEDLLAHLEGKLGTIAAAPQRVIRELKSPRGEAPASEGSQLQAG
jgi:GGDEF domain-containing protein